MEPNVPNHYSVYYIAYFINKEPFWQRLCVVEAYSEKDAIAGVNVTYGPPAIGKYRVEKHD